MRYGALFAVLLVVGCDDPDTEVNGQDIAELQDALAQLQAQADATDGKVGDIEATVDSTLGPRVEGLETAVDGLQAAGLATEAWVEAQSFATTELTDGLQGAVDTHGMAISQNQADISKNATDLGTTNAEIAANAADIASNTLDIGANTVDIGLNTTGVSANRSASAANASGVSANASGIANNATDIASNTTAIGTNRTDIATNTASIGTNRTDIASNTASTGTNRTNIASNTTAIGTNRTNIASNASSISTNVSNISDLDDAVADLDDDVADLQDAGKKHYATFRTGNYVYGPSTTWRTIPAAKLTFTKAQSASGLYVMYHDNLRVTGGVSSYCTYEVLIDGRSCSSPGPITGDIHENGNNIHRPSPSAGFCTATSAGAIGSGSHTITVRHRTPGNRGQCYTGWPSSVGHIFVEELAL